MLCENRTPAAPAIAAETTKPVILYLVMLIPTDSDAILRVLTGLGGAWRVVHVLRLIPAALRDPMYRLIARNRYRWFGRREACLVPDAAARDRFLP